MSLVFVSTSQETFTPTQSGALATIMYECCRVAQREGIEPFVVTRDSNAAPFDWPQTIFVPYPRIPESGPIWWAARLERKVLGWQDAGHRVFAGRMARAIAEHKLDRFPLVVLNNPETAILLRQKFPHAFIAHWFQNQLECKERVRDQLKTAVNCSMAVSNFTSRWVEKYYGFEESSVGTIYNATNVSHFVPRDSDKAAEPGSVRPVVSFVGRTCVEKAPDTLLQAAVILAQKGHKFSVRIIGSNYWDRFELDEFQQKLRGLANELKDLAIPVEFTGHVSRTDLPGVLQQGDINVMPSRWEEPCALATIEGMACGLATVASRTGGTPEVVGDAALLFERDNVRELSQHLQSLIQDEPLRREYSVRGRERAEQFSWDRTWQRLKELMQLEQ